MKKNCQILVVDDDPEDHLILLEYFREFGKDEHVKFLENGQEALDFLESIEDDQALPRLVVLDLNMPILNGTQTLYRLKQLRRFRNIPTIIFSTSDNENEKRKCMSFGAADYVVKPSTYEEGQQMVERFTGYISEC
jgi:CheY-like chemotaxis protein